MSVRRFIVNRPLTQNAVCCVNGTFRSRPSETLAQSTQSFGDAHRRNPSYSIVMSSNRASFVTPIARRLAGNLRSIQAHSASIEEFFNVEHLAQSRNQIVAQRHIPRADHTGRSRWLVDDGHARQLRRRWSHRIPWVWRFSANLISNDASSLPMFTAHRRQMRLRSPPTRTRVREESDENQFDCMLDRQRMGRDDASCPSG
jgi:hypothetical protein